MQKFKFKTTLDALAAREKITSLGINRNHTQLEREILLIDMRVVGEKGRDIEATVTYFGGFHVRAEVSQGQQSGATKTYFLPNESAVSACSLDIIEKATCRDGGSVRSSGGLALLLDAEHLQYGFPTPKCERRHHIDWSNILSVLARHGGKTPSEVDDEKRTAEKTETEFKQMQDRYEAESGSVDRGFDSRKALFFKFPSPLEAQSAKEAIIRTGEKGRSLCTKLKDVLLVDQRECLFWPDVTAAINFYGGKELKGKELIDVWFDHMNQKMLKFRFVSEQKAKEAVDRLSSDGVNKDFLRQEEKEVFVSTEAFKASRTVYDTVRSMQGEFISDVGAWHLT